MEEKKTTVTETPAELQEVIQRILDTDDEAKKITSEAKMQREQTERCLAQQKAELREHYLEKARRRIEQMKTEEETLAQNAIDAAGATHHAQLERLEQQYAEQKEAWADEIFRQVISR